MTKLALLLGVILCVSSGLSAQVDWYRINMGLYRAAQSNNVENELDPILNLLANDINQAIQAGERILHLAGRFDDPRIVLFFLPHADINQLNNARQTPLHLAIKNKNYKIARLLLEHGADAAVTDANGNTALQIAIINEDVKAVELILAYYATQRNFYMDENTESILRTALPIDGQPTAVSELCRSYIYLALLYSGALQAGELMYSDIGGVSAETIEELEWIELTKLHFNLIGDKRNNALLRAIRKGASAAEKVAALINQGANVDYRTPSAGITPLYIAVRYNNREAIETLIDHEANVRAQDAQGETILHLAVRMGDVDLLCYLLRREEIRPLLTTGNNRGQTPRALALALRRGNLAPLLFIEERMPIIEQIVRTSAQRINERRFIPDRAPDSL